MSFEDASACMQLPCCKKLHLLCLCVFLISTLLGTSVWAVYMFRASKLFIPLIVAIILLSMAEGALVLAILRAINGKSKDHESHDMPTCSTRATPPDRAGLFDQALIYPAFRDSNLGSLVTSRNFSLPRERCLDVVPPCDAPAIPVPHPYVATGMLAPTSCTHRPLPPLPTNCDDLEAPLPHDEEIDDVTILPLRIEKHESAVKQSTKDVDVESGKNSGPKPGAFDHTPVQPTHISKPERIITEIEAEQHVQEVTQEAALSVENSCPKSPTTGFQTPQTPTHLIAPAIVVQESTPTTPKSIQYPAPTLAGISTIRLVSPYLELPAMTGHGPRRQKSGRQWAKAKIKEIARRRSPMEVVRAYSFKRRMFSKLLE